MIGAHVYSQGPVKLFSNTFLGIKKEGHFEYTLFKLSQTLINSI